MSLTIVYRSPKRLDEKSLWEFLGLIADEVKGPWLITWDFNLSLCNSKRKGWVIMDHGSCKMFHEFMFNNSMRNLGFIRPPLTWHMVNLHKRVDWAICNFSSDEVLPNTGIQHLHKLKYDHWPPFIKIEDEWFWREQRPFIFLVGWMTHSSFNDHVKTTWVFDGSVKNTIIILIYAIKESKKFVFGNLNEWKGKVINDEVKGDSKSFGIS